MRRLRRHLLFLGFASALACGEAALPRPARRQGTTIPLQPGPTTTSVAAHAPPEDLLGDLDRWASSEFARINTSLRSGQTPNAGYPAPTDVSLAEDAWTCAPPSPAERARIEDLAQAFVAPRRKRPTGKFTFHACDGKGGACKVQAFAPCQGAPFAIIRDADEETEATWLVHTTSPLRVVRATPGSDTQIPYRWVGAADLDGNGELDLVLQVAATHYPCGGGRKDCDWSVALATVIWNAQRGEKASVQTLSLTRPHEDYVFLTTCNGITGLAVHEELYGESAPGHAARAYTFRGGKAALDPSLSACVFALETRRSDLASVQHLLHQCDGDPADLSTRLRSLAHPAMAAPWKELLEKARAENPQCASK